MKRVFSVEVNKTNSALLHGSRTFQVVAANATDAIDKATAAYRKDESWRGGVLVQSLQHRGRAI